MHHNNPYRKIIRPAALLAVLLLTAFGQSLHAKAGKPQLRIVCVTALAEDQELILASLSDKGKWRELAPVKLRTSSISEPFPAAAGELHLAVREGRTLKSICHFTYPTDSSEGLVALIADPAAKTYNAHFVDPEKAKFGKGTFLILNLSTGSSTVSLGTTEAKVEAGQHMVAKPTLEDNGMFRMLVSHPGENDTPEACYDRYVSGNKDSREMLFLLPDENAGLKVISLPLFVDLD